MKVGGQTSSSLAGFLTGFEESLAKQGAGASGEATAAHTSTPPSPRSPDLDLCHVDAWMRGCLDAPCGSQEVITQSAGERLTSATLKLA
jgi:hypothetical protein